MERTDGEREGGDGAESPTDDRTEQQEEASEAAEDWGGNVPPEDPVGPEPDDLTPQPPSDFTVADDFFVATNSDMERLEPQPVDEDEEEFLVLDPEHPLVRRHQAALSRQLSKQLERIDEDLKEKVAAEKEDSRLKERITLEYTGVEERLERLSAKLQDSDQMKAEAEARRRQAQDTAEAAKCRYSSTNSQCSKARANVSQLQAEIDNLMLHLVFTQGVSEDLHSNVKAMKNAKRKAGAEKDQAKEQKLKQDLYVDRLTKDMERLTEQIAMYEVQTSAQAEETQAAKEASTEAEVKMETLVMSRKQLLQQWNVHLAGMRRRDEAFSATQEAIREVEHHGILLDREIEGYKKSNTEEQELNETLIMQLNWSQMDIATSTKLIGQKKAQQDVLQAHYSTCLRTLRETESNQARLTKENNSHQAEVNEQRKQVERESARRLELEDKIMSVMQQKLTHNKAAKFSQQLVSKTAALKKEKISQLWHLENEMVAVGLESSEVGQHLDSLAATQQLLEEEIAKYDKLITQSQAKAASLVVLVGQRQSTVASYNRRISQVTANTGTEDLGPMQIKIEALMAQIEEVSSNIKSDQQLWMRRQGVLIGLTQDIEANSKNMLKLETEHTAMQQKKIRLEGQVEAEHQEQTEMEKKVKILRRDLVKLNTLLSKNGQLSQALEQENALIETDFIRRLKEAERESIEMQMKYERTQEEKERLLNSLVEAERQILLWEKKTQLAKETRSAVDSELGQGDVKMMKAEIHRMELKLNQLMKQQETLLRESEATVSRRETIVYRREALTSSSSRQSTTKGELSRIIQGLQRKIQDTNKLVAECEQAIKELQESQESLNERLALQKHRLIDACGASFALDSDFMNLQDTKDRNLSHVVALQSRTKKLQAVNEDSYQPLSTSESVAAALQSHTERVHSTNAILHRVCQEFPQHQGALRRLSLAIAARTQTLDQQAC